VLRAEDLVIRDARGLPAVDGVSFDVHRGEIFGIAGVQGNGQTELVEALVGLRPLAGGRVAWPGVTGPDPGPRTIREHGTAHIPEDRQRDGLLLTFSIADNLILCAADRAPFARWGQRIEAAILHHARALMRTFDIRARSEHTPVETLSGGNQQKVILARELSGEVRLVIANQPTRGLDVGAVEEIHARLRALRATGVGILLVSTELDELRALADRIAVLSRGHLVATLPAAETTPQQLGLLMAGTVR
jgi:simple sugar transport system ATP-binding protein